MQLAGELMALFPDGSLPGSQSKSMWATRLNCVQGKEVYSRLGLNTPATEVSLKTGGTVQR